MKRIVMLMAVLRAGFRVLGLLIALGVTTNTGQIRGQTTSFVRGLEGQQDSVPRGVAVDPSGVYIVGYTDSMPSKAFLGKYSSSGNQLWTRRLDGVGLGSVAVTTGVGLRCRVEEPGRRSRERARVNQVPPAGARSFGEGSGEALRPLWRGPQSGRQKPVRGGRQQRDRGQGGHGNRPLAARRPLSVVCSSPCGWLPSSRR